MEKLSFTGVTEENRAEFHRLMHLYARELDEHQNRNTNPETLTRWTDKIIEKQLAPLSCLKLCAIQSKVVGFLYGRICQPEDKGYKRIGSGYVMEFYILPEYRRKGFGRQMFRHLESFFKENGVKQIYLTADPVTGKPFWEQLGFISTGEISPENKQEIYKKELTNYSAEIVTNQTAQYVAMLYDKNIAALHGKEIPYSEWRSLISAGDTDERHFLIRKDAVPCAYLKINGLESGDEVGWISMLAVEPAFQRKGIGTFAVRFAEEYLRNVEKSKVKIHTTCDNIPAQRLYEKCGYTLSDEGGDKLTYIKRLN